MAGTGELRLVGDRVSWQLRNYTKLMRLTLTHRIKNVCLKNCDTLANIGTVELKFGDNDYKTIWNY